jgi:hypothetical protein
MESLHDDRTFEIKQQESILKARRTSIYSLEVAAFIALQTSGPA